MPPEVSGDIADLDLHLVEPPPDRERLQVLARQARQSVDTLRRARVMRRLADDLLDQGQARAAETSYREWLPAFAVLAPATETAVVHFRLATLLARANSPDEARVHLRSGFALLGAAPAEEAVVVGLIAEAWLAIQEDRGGSRAPPQEV